jgi:ribosomal protein S8
MFPFFFFFFEGYIGEFEYVDDHRSGKIVVELNGRLNKCGVISPRFDVGVKEIEGWTARLLPSRQVSLRNSLSIVLCIAWFLKKRIVIDGIVCMYG